MSSICLFCDIIVLSLQRYSNEVTVLFWNLYVVLLKGFKADFDTERSAFKSENFFVGQSNLPCLTDQLPTFLPLLVPRRYGGIAAYQTDGLLNHVVEEGLPPVMLLSMKSVIWFAANYHKDKSLFINARKMVVFY